MIFDGLYDDERFRQTYVSGALSTQQGEVTAFYRRDWLAQHAPAGIRILPWPADAPVARCNQSVPNPEPASQ
jgi:hypothetical protein